MSQIEPTFEGKAYDKTDGKQYEWVLHNVESTSILIHENVSIKIKRQKSNQTECKGVSKCNNNTKKLLDILLKI